MDTELESEIKLPTGKETSRPLVTVALMLAMFLAAIEVTIVATAMPTIVGMLGGFQLYSWVFSAYLVTQVAFIPIFGKLADLYGRKPVFVVSCSLFLLGTLLCGLARSMEMLVAFRALQGLGAAGLLPLTQTIIGDLYSLQERAKIQGLMASIWGISSVLGPALGGLIVDQFTWPWIFYLNLPLGLLALLVIGLFLHENITGQRHQVDYKGSILLVVGVSSLLIFLIQGGSGWAWTSGRSIGILLLTMFTLGWFYWWERQAAEPLLPLQLFRNRIIVTCNLAVLFAGALVVGVSAFIPAYVQGVFGTSATVAGLVLGVMSLSWALVSPFSARLMLVLGYRWTAVLGSCFIVLACFILLIFPEWQDPWKVTLATFCMGIGMALTATTFIVAVQEAVDWSQRGIATSSNSFMRMLGKTLGVAVYANLLNQTLVARLSALPRELVDFSQARGLDMVGVLLQPTTRANLTPAVRGALTGALNDALQVVFLALLGTAIIGAIVVWWLPGGKVVPRKY